MFEATDPVMLFILGVIATLLAQAVKLAAAKFNVELGRVPVTVGTYVASLIFAIVVAKPVIPPYGDDPALFVDALFATGSTIFAVATIIYNLLIEKVFAKLGWTKEAVLAHVRYEEKTVG
jgi:hypothetical protein